MKTALTLLLAVAIALPAVVGSTYKRGPVEVTLSQTPETENHSEEPVPADCFVDPQTGEVEVIRTDGEGDLYVTVFEESIPVASTVVDAEDDEGSVFVPDASGDMTANVTTETGGEFEGFFYL